MYTPDPNHRRLTLDSFEHHTPTAEQTARIELNRSSFKACADVVLRTTPPGRDQRAALRYLHEALMTANKSIALEATQLVESGERTGGSTFAAADPNLIGGAGSSRIRGV